MAWYPVLPLTASALEIACQFGRTAYDSLYLALAVAENGILITADERLYDSVSSTVLGGFVTLLI